jgi:hypothetical protein
MEHDKLKEKYPERASELDAARLLMESSTSIPMKMMYQNKQDEFNALIKELFTHAKEWNDGKIRYTIVKMEVLHDEIKKLQEAKTLYNDLVKAIEEEQPTGEED